MNTQDIKNSADEKLAEALNHVGLVDFLPYIPQAILEKLRTSLIRNKGRQTKAFSATIAEAVEFAVNVKTKQDPTMKTETVNLEELKKFWLEISLEIETTERKKTIQNYRSRWKSYTHADMQQILNLRLLWESKRNPENKVLRASFRPMSETESSYYEFGFSFADLEIPHSHNW